MPPPTTELPIPSASDELNASMRIIGGCASSNPCLTSSDHIAPDEMMPVSEAMGSASLAGAQRVEHRARERVAHDHRDHGVGRLDRVEELVGVVAARGQQDHGPALGEALEGAEEPGAVHEGARRHDPGARTLARELHGEVGQ